MEIQLDDPAWVRRLLAAGRTYQGTEIPPTMFDEVLREGRVVEVEVGSSAYGSSSVAFSLASPSDLERMLRFPADYLVAKPPSADDLARRNDHDWDSGREFWSYHRQAQDSIFRGVSQQRVRLKRSMALMLSELMNRLAFPYRAWSTSHRELLRAYGRGESVGQRLRQSHWSPQFVFDPENEWEERGDIQALLKLWESLHSHLTSYVSDVLARRDHDRSHSEVRRDDDRASATANILGRDARRWASEAMWAIREGDGEDVPTCPGLFRLPQPYSADQRPDPDELQQQLIRATTKLAGLGPVSMATSSLIFLIRTINWSLAPPEEIDRKLEQIRLWCYTYEASAADGKRLRAELKDLTTDPVLLEPLALIDGRSESDPAWVTSLTIEISEELGRREFHRLTAGLTSTASSALECGQLWGEAARHEMLNTVFIRLGHS